VDGSRSPQLRVSFLPSSFSFSRDILLLHFLSRLAWELHERFVEKDGCYGGMLDLVNLSWFV
jgi:hypothetical protein